MLCPGVAPGAGAPRRRPQRTGRRRSHVGRRPQDRLAAVRLDRRRDVARPDARQAIRHQLHHAAPDSGPPGPTLHLSQQAQLRLDVGPYSRATTNCSASGPRRTAPPHWSRSPRPWQPCPRRSPSPAACTRYHARSYAPLLPARTARSHVQLSAGPRPIRGGSHRVPTDAAAVPTDGAGLLVGRYPAPPPSLPSS